MGLWMRIMIADDETLSRQILRFMVEKTEHKICAEAASGDEVITKVKETDPDLLLLDIRMPGRDGISAAKEIRKFNHRISIVFITAYEDFNYAPGGGWFKCQRVFG